MHIKQVIISGFRSFRNQGEIESFSPKHNVIVGRNGSGKSNFFNAIQFVLVAPKFANLRQEDRQALLHEGAGSSVMSAYVEIIFDNADGRLSVDSDEVILRRTIGHKKDEFFLNRKRIQKNEVISLLESAGFSKSNPYYIVQQGKVANLCVMRDKDRLNLLKEIAGTTVYEERRDESLKILLDTTHKQERIKEVLTFIEERLSELEKEKEELKEYDYLDKKRRALQYTLYDKELRKLTSQLEAVEATRSESLIEQQDMFVALNKLQDELQSEEDQVLTARQALARLVNRREAKMEEIQALVAKRSQLQVDLQELKADGQSKVSAVADCRAQMEEVKAAIALRQRELAEMAPEHAQHAETLATLEAEQATTTQRLETLYGKQGRGMQFTNKAERNSFLQDQIKLLQEQHKAKEALFQRLFAEAAEEDLSLSQEGSKQKAAEQATIEHNSHLEELSVQAKTLLTRRNAAQEVRKTAWKESEAVQEALLEVKADLDKAQHALNASLPRHVSQGLACVERIAMERGMVASGAYKGPVIDNFSMTNEAFRLAVETAAGNSLFHVIVDTDSTAAILMKELERRKAGRLTFLPLNRLSTQPIQYPDTTDVRSLMEVALVFDPSVTAAISQVFGKKLLARDLDIAARYSKECQLDAITKEGDVVSRKGGFEGGYHDERASKIICVQKIRESRERLNALTAQSQALKQRCDQAEAEVNDTLRDLQVVESERENVRRHSVRLTAEMSSRRRSLEIAKENLEKRRSGGIASLEKEIRALRAQISVFEEEMKTPLKVSLSEAERAEIQVLIERSQQLQEEVTTAEQNVTQVNTERERCRVDLRDNLLKRQEELDTLLASLLGTGTGGMTDDGSGRGKKKGSTGSSRVNNAANDQVVLQEAQTQCEADLDRVSHSVREQEVELETLDLQMSQKQSELQLLELQLDNTRQAEYAQQESIIQAGKSQDKLLNKRSMLYETSQQKQRNIMELGSLPRQQVEECQNLNEKAILSGLKDANERLKEFGGVNRKALDQYISFNEQRQELMDRQEELSTDKDAIQQLMDSLDMQKEETILNTFQSVSGHFADVFSELVPGGMGRMVMVTAADQAQGDADDETGSSTSPPNIVSISAFLGVRIEVSFISPSSSSSEGAQVFEMQQLSGGQKALVALALIFSIQRCDPAPFYLFDEIDQALDANYRAGVARLVHAQANDPDAPAQFITTTFRPELVAAADQCYGIALQNKVSNIYPLEKSDAETFVTNLMTEEETVGATAVSNVASYSASSASRSTSLSITETSTSSIASRNQDSTILSEERSYDEFSEDRDLSQSRSGVVYPEEDKEGRKGGSPPSITASLEEEEAVSEAARRSSSRSHKSVTKPTGASPATGRRSATSTSSTGGRRR